jgi:hypothetical protein
MVHSMLAALWLAVTAEKFPVEGVHVSEWLAAGAAESERILNRARVEVNTKIVKFMGYAKSCTFCATDQSRVHVARTGAELGKVLHLLRMLVRKFGMICDSASDRLPTASGIGSSHRRGRPRLREFRRSRARRVGRRTEYRRLCRGRRNLRELRRERAAG